STDPEPTPTELTSTEPEPTSAEPEPTSTDPEPTSIDPEPTSIDPTSTEPEPTSSGPTSSEPTPSSSSMASASASTIAPAPSSTGLPPDEVLVTVTTTESITIIFTESLATIPHATEVNGAIAPAAASAIAAAVATAKAKAALDAGVAPEDASDVNVNIFKWSLWSQAAQLLSAGTIALEVRTVIAVNILNVGFITIFHTLSTDSYAVADVHHVCSGGWHGPEFVANARDAPN
ncbi:hypothetical protein EVG20_g8975, partial [Dentipellis fragilis]